MNRKDRSKRVIMFLEGAMIVALQTAVFAFVWYTCYVKRIHVPYWRRGNWAVIGMYALLFFLFSKLYGALRVGYLRVMDVVYSQLISLFCTNVAAYVEILIIDRELWKHALKNLAPIGQMSLVQLAVMALWVLAGRWIYGKLYPPRKMLIIYGKKSPQDLIEKLSSRKDKYEIYNKVHISEGVKKITEKIQKAEAVVIWDLPAQQRNDLLKICFRMSVRTYISPKLSDILISASDNIHLFDTPLLLSRNQGLSLEQRLGKRILDLVVSCIGLVLTSPLMILFSLLIKCYDRGPVLYKQERLTLDGRVFKIYKFRSMICDSEKNGARLAKKNDDRITPVGRVLRKYHLDELPQLLNILKGEMSVVGPRPERPEIAMEYQREIPEFDFRLKIKAGLTGYAQVYGKYNTTPYDKLKLDLYYIEHYSFFMDIRLILLTVKTFFQKENTEGVEDWQKTAKK